MAAATLPQIAGSNRKTNAVPPSVAPIDQISGPDVTSSTLRKPRPLLPTLLFGSFGLWPSWQSPLKSFRSNACPLFATRSTGSGAVSSENVTSPASPSACSTICSLPLNLAADGSVVILRFPSLPIRCRPSPARIVLRPTTARRAELEDPPPARVHLPRRSPFRTDLRLVQLCRPARWRSDPDVRSCSSRKVKIFGRAADP